MGESGKGIVGGGEWEGVNWDGGEGEGRVG